MSLKINFSIITSIENWKISPVIKASYQVTKKIIKHGFYIFILYFSFKGFVA